MLTQYVVIDWFGIPKRISQQNCFSDCLEGSFHERFLRV